MRKWHQEVVFLEQEFLIAGDSDKKKTVESARVRRRGRGGARAHTHAHTHTRTHTYTHTYTHTHTCNTHRWASSWKRLESRSARR